MDVNRFLTRSLPVLLTALPAFILVLLQASVSHVSLFVLYTLLGIGGSYLWDQRIKEKEELSDEILRQGESLRKMKEAPPRISVDPNLPHRVYHEGFLGLRLIEECERSRRYQRPFSCLVVQIDDFEGILKSHPALKPNYLSFELAKFIKRNLRLVDIVIRKRDDHLIVIMPETASTGVRIAAERVRYAIERNMFHVDGNALKMTVTLSMLTYDRMIYLGNEQVMQALERLWGEARQKGPNRVLTLAE